MISEYPKMYFGISLNVFMDILNSFMDILYSFLDIHNSFMDILKEFRISIIILGYP